MNQSIWDKLQNLDRRWLYTLLFVVIGTAMIRPMGLPISIRPWTQTSFEAINKAIKPGQGDLVFFMTDFQPSLEADVGPAAETVFNLLMQSGCKVVCATVVAQGTRYITGYIANWETKGKKYGTDFIDLGFIPGEEVGLSSLMGDIIKTVPRDARGNNTASVPIMNGVKSLADFKLFTGFSVNYGPQQYVRQLPQYKVPLIVGSTTQNSTEIEPYFRSGQLAGVLVGFRGGAEFELLMKQPGKGVAGMDAQSTGHFVILAFIVLGNIGYIMKRLQAKNGGAGR